MQLYFFPNTIAVATAITLEEAGMPYEPCRLNFPAGEQTQPDYLKINPKGRVPALAIDGEIITETGALLELIAHRAPQARLMPNDIMAATRVRSVMYYLASTMHVNHAHGRRASRWADNPESHADMAAKVPETMTASAQFVEAECLTGPYILGEEFTAGDAYLFVICNWLEGDGVALEGFPKIRAHLAAMEGRASVKAVRAKGILK